MKKKFIVIAVISSLSFAQTHLHAEETHLDVGERVVSPQIVDEKKQTEELIGLSSGAVIGAVAGGPVGAFIGGFVGALIGQSMSDHSEIKMQNERLVEQQLAIETQTGELTALHKSKQSMVDISDDYSRLQSQLTDLRATQEQMLQELAIGLNIQFKTGSSTIEPHFAQQLDNVAYVLVSSPELRLDLAGYADRTGGRKFNQTLSEKRLSEVKKHLISKGVSEARLSAQAYGSTAPLHAQQSFDNDFFDRRVSLKIIPTSQVFAAH